MHLINLFWGAFPAVWALVPWIGRRDVASVNLSFGHLSTKITYSLPKSLPVKINVYDILGREIRTLMNRTELAGIRSVNWDGLDNFGQKVPSGIYFYDFSADDYFNVKKIIPIA